MKATKEVIEVSEQLQQECNELAKTLSGAEVSWQDATNVWIFTKLAEQEVRLRKIETQLGITL